MVDGRRHSDRAATGDRAQTHLDTGGIGKGNDDVLGGDSPSIGHHLSKDRLHTLALCTGPGGGVNLTGGIDADGRALEGSHTSSLDIVSDAEPEITARLARFALAPAKCRDTADRIERLLQRA